MGSCVLFVAFRVCPVVSGICVRPLVTAVSEMNGQVTQLKEEIVALNAGFRALDKSVAEATEQRKAENANYKELMTNDKMA